MILLVGSGRGLSGRVSAVSMEDQMRELVAAITVLREQLRQSEGARNASWAR